MKGAWVAEDQSQPAVGSHDSWHLSPSQVLQPGVAPRRILTSSASEVPPPFDLPHSVALAATESAAAVVRRAADSNLVSAAAAVEDRPVLGMAESGCQSAAAGMED